MQVKKVYTSDTHVTLTITADQNLIDAVKEKVLRHMNQSHVKLPGFRPGKAPLQLVEKQADQNLLQSEFLDEAVNKMYSQVLKSEQLRPIEQPKVTLKKFVPFSDFEFEAEVDVIGKLTLADYKAVRMQPTKVSITASEVTEVLASLKKRLAERSDVDRPAASGDEVTIDFSGVDNAGKPVNGADGKDYPLIIGSNSFIPGFEPKLIGIEVGKPKTFTVAFPKDYGVAALQNRKVTFTVTAKKIQALSEPKLDDSFAAKAGPFKTLEELKADIKKQLGVERQQQADRDYQNAILLEIASKSKVAIPNKLIDEEVERMEQSERQNLTYRGTTWQEHLAEEGVDEAKHRERNRPNAAESLKAGIILSAIAEAEQLSITPEELAIQLQLLKGQYTDPTMQAELDKEENRRDIENRLLTEKTLAVLTKYAQAKN